MSESAQLHATCVSIGGNGVLLFGPSGCGKSDLALQLIDRGALLVGDDQVQVRRSDDTLIASPSDRIHGLLETRGIGILHLPFAREIPVAVAVKLVARELVERMPHHQFFDCLGVRLPLLLLHAFDSSTPAKIRLYLRHAAMKDQ